MFVSSPYPQRWALTAVAIANTSRNTSGFTLNAELGWPVMQMFLCTLVEIPIVIFKRQKPVNRLNTCFKNS